MRSVEINKSVLFPRYAEIGKVLDRNPSNCQFAWLTAKKVGSCVADTQPQPVIQD